VAALAQEHGKEEFADLRWWGQFVASSSARLPSRSALIGALGAGAYRPEIASDRWQVITRKLERVPSLAHVSETCDTVLIELAAWRAELEQINSIQEDKPKCWRPLVSSRALWNKRWKPPEH